MRTDMSETLVIWDGPGYFDVTYDPHTRVFVIQAREPDEDTLVTVAMTHAEAGQLASYVGDVLGGIE